MAEVRVLPVDVEITVDPDETVFAAARRHGYRWPTICEGKGQCTACHMLVVSGTENLSDIEQLEQERLDSLKHLPSARGSWRLACQTRLLGDVIVEKIGVRRRQAAG